MLILFSVELSHEGDGFATRVIDLGGLQVTQISTFNKVWSTHDGGLDNKGATIFEPKNIPKGFYMLGSYSQPNNKALYGWVLVAKDVSSNTTDPTLKQPSDYALLWDTQYMNISQEGHAYVWLPIAPNGYKAVGHVVTTTPDKPSLDKIRCVREDLTDQSEQHSLIWSKDHFFFVYDVRPSNRGIEAPGVRVGTFVAQTDETTTNLSISCLKNINANKTSSMPNLQQIDAIMEFYSPFLVLHPNEEFYPSSVNWFFSNGALLYTKGQESAPIIIKPNGTNLPQGGENDGAYWIDLPTDGENKDRVSKGFLNSSRSYLHVKPMYGSTFTDLALWIFYPYNGAAKAKLQFIKNIKLGKIGEHVGDWEHVTLRVSNFNGQLWKMYFSQHNKGTWLDASQLEFNVGNKPNAYSSLHGHASYPHAGLTLLGKGGVGARDDTEQSDFVFNMGAYELISAKYLGSTVIEPPWLNFNREWGPHIYYDLGKKLKKMRHLLPGKLKSLIDDIVKVLPKEVLGEEGPMGPKGKNNWSGDEV
ncbi:putative vacuolar protein sorting-associated protein [Lupinus albus]|uniref:Putative vacuolar protein sorting-associated protein n=1 Tax=Lupinus albus TaxID=3870 RepID=A0A6A4MYY3_LUPAL|nr:putative vacuolar protein sorting-associated protein [Lupinus albus]